MKNFIIIILLLIVLCIGINVGSGSDKTKSEIIKDKIEDFESGVENENKIYNTIQPTIINEIAIFLLFFIFHLINIIQYFN